MRRVIVLACAVVLAIAVLPALLALPSVGVYLGPYGDAVVPVSLAQRHTTNFAATVAYDVRGFDTLGEESILFAAVIGVSVLLRPRGEAHREERGTDRAGAASRPSRGSRPALRRTSRNVLALTIVFGACLSLHATQTPGGGFQGGAMIASAIALVYLGGGYALWSRVVREVPFDIGEVAGLGAFVAIAVVPLAAGGALLANWLPPGKTGQFASGGTMFAINIGIAVAVAAGFALIVNAQLYDLHEDTEALGEDERPRSDA